MDVCTRRGLRPFCCCSADSKLSLTVTNILLVPTSHRPLNPFYPLLLHSRKFIRLHLPGFTRGERNGTAGEDLGFNSEDDDGNTGLAWPSDT